MTLKKNDLAEIKKSGLKSVTAKISALKLELADAKLKLTRGQLKNVALPRLLRRDIARLATIQHELAASASQATSTKESK